MKMDAPYMVFKGTQLKGKSLGDPWLWKYREACGGGSPGPLGCSSSSTIYQGEVDIEEIGIRKVNTLAELMRESDL